MKQTAVEWLVERLTETPYIDDFWGHVKQAKEMEKNQIMHAWLIDGYIDFTDDKWIKDFEAYYNFSYKKTNDMKTWKVIYKGYAHKMWVELEKIVKANTREDAIKKADLWEGIILNVIEL